MASTTNDHVEVPTQKSTSAVAGVNDQSNIALEDLTAKEVADLSSSDDQSDGVVGPVVNVQYLSGVRLWVMLGSITLVMFLMMIDTSILGTAIPSITDEFRSLKDVGWYISVYQLASAAVQPLSGKIYSKFSNKWTFMSFFLLFEIGSTVCAAATSSVMLIVGRALAGVGGGGIMNGGLTIVSSAVPMEQRPPLIGVLMGLSQLGIVVGPLLGGVFTSFVSWRWCFWINLPCGGLVAVCLVWVNLPEIMQKPKPWTVVRSLHTHLDLVGFALVSPAAVMLLLALQWGGNDYNWDSAVIIGLFCGSGVTALAWLLWDWYRGEDALIPLSMLRKRVVWTSALTQWLLITIVYCASFFLPMYFQAVKGETPIMSGVDVLPSILSQLVAAVVSGKLVQWVGYVIPFAVLGAALGATSNGLLSTLSPSTLTGQWAGYQIINGLGRGISMQMPMLAIQIALGDKELPIATGVLVFVQTLGVSVMLTVADTIFQTSLETEIPRRAPQVNTSAVIAAGATRFRTIVSEDQLPAVLDAYSVSISRIFLFATGISGLAMITALGMGWKNLRTRNQDQNAAATSGESGAN